MRVLDRFRSLSQMQQIALIAGLIGMFCALLAAIWLLFLRVPYQPLFTDLRPADAATILAELDRRKIPYRISNGGSAISIPADRVDATRLNIMTQDLPLKGTVGFELFNKSDMGLTEFAQKINYTRAIQGELERTIMTLDGVSATRVHVSMGEDRIFREDQVPPKASVTVRMAKGAALDANAVLGIQRLIAAAVPKLETSNVVVLDEEGRTISAVPVPETQMDVPEPADTQQKLVVERFYEARIRQIIQQVFPAAEVQVSAVAAIPTESVDRILSTWNPTARKFPLQVTLSSAHGLGEEVERGMRNALTAGIGLDPANGDLVEFGLTRQPRAVEPQVPRSQVVPKAQDWSPENTKSDVQSWYWEVPYVLVPVFVLGAITFLLRRAQRPRRLSEAQRAAFTAKLQRALEGRAGNAATSP